MNRTRDEVIRHCAVCGATGNRLDLRGLDLRGLDLSGIDLRGSDLRNVDLSYSNLSGDLRGSDLRDSNLRGLDLRDSSLSGSDLSGSNLRDSDLSGSNLTRANLRGADLTGVIGVVCLQVHDPRGYLPVAVDHGTHWMIASGCRWLTAADALEHWGSDDYHTPDLGQAYCRAIRELPEPGQ